MWSIGRSPLEKTRLILVNYPTLPDPPPERLFLLNRHRQFVPYEL
ncbi:hypothetical protein NW840_13440 [Synechococcus sp. R5-13]